MDDVDAQKKALRQRFRAWRAALPEDAYADRSAALVDALLALPELASARTVHAYAPAIDRREPDLWPLLDALHARGVAVVMPVVMPAVASVAPPVLHHRRYEGRAALRPDAAGLLAPTGPALSPDTPHGLPVRADVILVPALAVDRRGVRLGYGKGFYDRFLATNAPDAFTVCPAFRDTVVERLPATPYDMPVRCLVTEDGRYDVPRPSRSAPPRRGPSPE